MSTVVYGLATSDQQAIRIANRLERAGFTPDDISVIGTDAKGVRDLGIENSTKAPEGAATGATTGTLLGGAIGWLAGAGMLAIPGLGPLVAAGPILATLTGAAVGGTTGGLTGALIGAGIPEYEAQLYERKLRDGNFLFAVHAADGDEAASIRQVLQDEKAESISTGTEAGVAHKS